MAELRPARAADISRLIEIRAGVRENRLQSLVIGADDYCPYIADGRCWVWEEDGALLGFSALDAAAASVWALFVLPRAEGRGIGRALLGAAVADARRRDLDRLTLTTAAGTRAEALYRAAGFTVADRDEPGDIRMRLTL